MSEEAGSLTEEIVYIMNVAAGSSLVESMIRLKRRESSAKGEFSILVELKPVVRETIARYWTGGGTACWVPHSEPRTASDQLEATFSDLAKDKLSLREETVVSFLLRGHSTLSVAHNLGIAEGTVKLNQTNIYEKLHIISHA